MNKRNIELEKILKYNFKKSYLLEKALTHKSFNNNINNEKLEFLGDRVLGLVISEKLLEKYPDEKEGIIDKKYANLVNKKTCLLIAKKINLKKFILLGDSHKKLERSADKISSDCLEAVVGAIYLDGGLKYAEKFILFFWKEYLLKSTVTLIDSKTKLKFRLNKNHFKQLSYRIEENKFDEVIEESEILAECIYMLFQLVRELKLFALSSRKDYSQLIAI